MSFLKGTKERVLQLLKQSNTILSGETIAQQLHVSRTAIWKAIRELEKIGYKIEHLANGYRFIQSNLLEAEEIAFEHLPAQQIYIAKETESTMKLAKMAAMDQQATPALFLAETQTGGHGRFARPFFSPPGQIYMTLLLKANQSFAELPQYTILAAVAVALAIDEVTGKTCQIKWVNDIYLEEKKVCGILSEATSDFESGQISYVTIGIGLNFHLNQTDFPTELQEKVTALFSDTEPTITRNELIQKIWQNFFELIAGLPDQSYLEYYRRKSFVLGKVVRFTQQGQEYTGQAVGISNHGELIVETVDGQKVLSSGEISLSQIGEKKLRG